MAISGGMLRYIAMKTLLVFNRKRDVNYVTSYDQLCAFDYSTKWKNPFVSVVEQENEKELTALAVDGVASCKVEFTELLNVTL